MFFRFTVFYHAKIGLDIIRKYVEGMKEKDVLRLAAEKCGIGLKTSSSGATRFWTPSAGPLGREDVRTLRAIPTYFRRMSMLFEGVFPLFQNKIYIHARCQQP